MRSDAPQIESDREQNRPENYEKGCNMLVLLAHGRP